MKKQITVLVLALGLALSGCSGDDGKKAAKDPATQQAAPGPEEPMAWPAGIAEVKGFKAVSGGIDTSTFGPCDLKPGTHTIKGSVTSSSPQKRDFVAVITWTDKVGKVVGQGSQIIRNVAPGAEAQIKVTGKVKKPAAQCLPAVLAGTAE